MPINYKNYPPNWKTEIVPAILDRAKGKCEFCDLANHQTVFAIKITMKDQNGKYKLRSLWFRNEQDAIREAGAKDHETGDILDIVKPVKVVLTIAHLDHDELNHSVPLHRLKALCQLCHLRYDAAEKYRRSLLPKSFTPQKDDLGITGERNFF